MRRTRRDFSEEHVEQIWARWKTGETISEIGRAISRKPGSVFGVLADSGGIAPRNRRRSPRHMRADERETISRGIAAGMSLRAIAIVLGRAPSTVSREVRRNGGRASYRATSAESEARRSSGTTQTHASRETPGVEAPRRQEVSLVLVAATNRLRHK